MEDNERLYDRTEQLMKQQSVAFDCLMNVVSLCKDKNFLTVPNKISKEELEHLEACLRDLKMSVMTAQKLCGNIKAAAHAQADEKKDKKAAESAQKRAGAAKKASDDKSIAKAEKTAQKEAQTVSGDADDDEIDFFD